VGFSVEIHAGEPEHEDEGEVELQGIVRRENGTLIQRFREQVPPGPEEHKLFREIQLRPGRYFVSAVLSGPRGRPRTATLALELPELPEPSGE
jgi:hypothetical protein